MSYAAEEAARGGGRVNGGMATQQSLSPLKRHPRICKAHREVGDPLSAGKGAATGGRVDVQSLQDGEGARHRTAAGSSRSSGVISDASFLRFVSAFSCLHKRRKKAVRKPLCISLSGSDFSRKGVS